jgi:gamma-glutamyltranspeptidase/glutathione hydrolase
MLRLALVLAALSSMASQDPSSDGGALGGDRLAGAPFASRSAVIARHGMAATSHPLASQAAVDVLKAGGSAVDAAIAANAVLALAEPTGCGLGGDLFAIVWDPEGKRLHGLNASGRSPRGLTLAELKERLGERDRIPSVGPLPVSVPGAVSGWGALHARFGKLPLAEVLAPAIRYATEGIPIPQTIAHHWRGNVRSLRRRAEQVGELDNFLATFTVDGRAPREGDVFANPDLARTLSVIAKEGTDAFYKGELADRMDAYFRRVGCFLRKEDLAAHAADWVEPISTTYRGVEVHELPPNGQGLAALQMLNVLEGYDLAEMGRGSADALHVMVEAKKLAFADRARLYVDPDFFDVPLQQLLSKEYAAQRRERIDMEQALPAVDAGLPDGGDTIYLATADSSGMMVSLIQSNYRGMGSGLVPDGLGFGLQDRGELFALDEDHPNVYAPGKRPFHTIIPAFATRDGEPWMAFGVMGGDLQPQGHVQILVNRIDFGLGIQEAGDAPRFEHTGSSAPTGEVMTDGGSLHLERGVPAGVREELARRGHRITPGGYFGGYQAIEWDPARGVYLGATEMRKDGQVCGW